RIIDRCANLADVAIRDGVAALVEQRDAMSGISASHRARPDLIQGLAVAHKMVELGEPVELVADCAQFMFAPRDDFAWQRLTARANHGETQIGPKCLWRTRLGEPLQ